MLALRMCWSMVALVKPFVDVSSLSNLIRILEVELRLHIVGDQHNKLDETPMRQMAIASRYK